MGPIGPMWPQRRCFCCCPPRASVSSASSAVRSLRRLAPGRQHRGQRRVGVRAARVDVRDDGLRGKGSGRLARLAALLGHELRHRRRPDRLDRRRPDARHGLGPDRPVGHPAEGVQVEPDHLGVAGVQAPEQGAPRLPFQPLHDRRRHVCPDRRRLPPSAAACPGTRTASLAALGTSGACPRGRSRLPLQAVKDGLARRGREWAAAHGGALRFGHRPSPPPLPYDSFLL